MGLHSAEAIVLRSYPYRETSVIVSCLTDRYGKLKGLVKGLRNYPNRHRSAMEPLTINRVVFYDTLASQLHLISQCDLVDSLPALQRDLETMRTAALCVELIEALVPLEEPHPAIYLLLKRILERLALGGEARLALEAHCIVRLLRLAGFQPQLDECTACATSLTAEGYWSARQGGLLCHRCLHEDPQAAAVVPELLAALHALSQTDQPVSLEPQLLGPLRQRLDDFLHWRLERPLRSVG